MYKSTCTKVHVQYAYMQLILCVCMCLVLYKFVLSQCLALSSLGANCTSQFPPSCVRWACNPSAGCFHVVEQNSILTSSTSRHCLRVLINTFKQSAMVIIAFSHQVAVVLAGPGGRAGSLCRYHQHCPPGENVTHCTRHILIMK